MTLTVEARIRQIHSRDPGERIELDSANVHVFVDETEDSTREPRRGTNISLDLVKQHRRQWLKIFTAVRVA